MSDLAPKLLALLASKGATLGSIESMTAGLFGASFCSVPGASKVYLGGLITYDPQEKIALAHVPSATIKEYGVVSKEVALAMAEGGRKALKVDLAVSVTGNAGPTTCPGYGEVGDYFIGIVYRNKGYTFYKKGQGQRNEIRAQAVESMMACLLQVVNELAQ
jgi:PncC family amidohydrolase